MYLFSRRARLNLSDGRGAIVWATQMTEHVIQVTGHPVRLWNKMYSPEVGTIGWTTIVPDLPALEGFNDKLMVDDGYHELVERGLKYINPATVDDQLGVFVHPETLPDVQREAEYAVVVRTTCAAGHVADGMALGVEIAQRVQELTGQPTAFLAGATGNYGGVAWITQFTDAAELERSEMTINTDAGFIELIDQRAARAYTDTPGASIQEIFRKVV